MVAVGIGLGLLMALLQLHLTRRMTMLGRPMAHTLLISILKLFLWVAVMLLVARISIPALIALVVTVTVVFLGYLITRHARSR